MRDFITMTYYIFYNKNKTTPLKFLSDFKFNLNKNINYKVKNICFDFDSCCSCAERMRLQR